MRNEREAFKNVHPVALFHVHKVTECGAESNIILVDCALIRAAGLFKLKS